MVPAQKESADKPKMRQIIIETDGTTIHIGRCEVASTIELIGILNSILGMVDSGRLRINANFQVAEPKEEPKETKPAEKPEEKKDGKQAGDTL